MSPRSSHRNPKSGAIAIATATLVLSVACGSSTPTPAPKPTATVAPTSAPVEAATVAPTEVPTAEPPKSVPGVNLTLDPALGKSIGAQIMPAVPKSEGPAFNGATPEHVLITFDGETLDENDPRQRQIGIYPVEGLRAIDPTIGKSIDELKRILDRKSATVRGDIPFWPVQAAQQVFHSNMEYVKFANGDGIRFVTRYAQDVSPITNADLFYAFQGLTSDGQYLVSARYPLSAEGLPESFDSSPAATSYDEFSKNFEKYLKDTTAQLDKLKPEQFKPDLSKLDSMLTSLQATPQLTDTAAAPVADPNQGEAPAQGGKATATPAADNSSASSPSTAPADASATIRRLVNMRATPSLRGKVIQQLSRNSKVKLLGRDARTNWIQVETEDGKQGWVNRPYLVTKTNLRTLPVVP